MEVWAICVQKHVRPVTPIEVREGAQSIIGVEKAEPLLCVQS